MDQVAEPGGWYAIAFALGITLLIIALVSAFVYFVGQYRDHRSKRKNLIATNRKNF